MRKFTSHLSVPELRASQEKLKTLMEVDYA
jgi:hypothetical protein